MGRVSMLDSLAVAAVPAFTGARPVRLLCFPFAGRRVGVPSLSSLLAPGMDVCAFEPPGRGTRFGESAFRRLDDYVDAVMPTVWSLTDQPFVLFGHSMGAMVAVECAKRLLHIGREPALIALSAFGKGPSLRKPVHHLPASEMIHALRTYGGSPPEVLADEEMMEMLLPMLRADFELVETHTYSDDTRFACPVLALGGIDDPYHPTSHLEAWSTITTGAFTLKTYPGGHFYLWEVENAVFAALREALSVDA